MNTQRPIRVALTPEQGEQVRLATGAVGATVTLTLETLEDRAAPRCIVIYKDAMSPK